tara:strand:+ start:155 stop:544 length:390 start_codon:yes stop_codon:yes gene_type:complete
MQFTVIKTSSIDDYKRPQTDSYVVLTTSDYSEAVTAAANEWLNEYESDFVYGGIADHPHILDVKRILQDDPSAEEINDFFQERHAEIWESEFISQPWFNVEIQTGDILANSYDLDNNIIETLKSAVYNS